MQLISDERLHAYRALQIVILCVDYYCYYSCGILLLAQACPKMPCIYTSYIWLWVRGSGWQCVQYKHVCTCSYMYERTVCNRYWLLLCEGLECSMKVTVGPGPIGSTLRSNWVLWERQERKGKGVIKILLLFFRVSQQLLVHTVYQQVLITMQRHNITIL